MINLTAMAIVETIILVLVTKFFAIAAVSRFEPLAMLLIRKGWVVLKVAKVLGPRSSCDTH